MTVKLKVIREWLREHGHNLDIVKTASYTWYIITDYNYYNTEYKTKSIKQLITYMIKLGYCL